MTKNQALRLALEALLRSKRAVSEDLDLAGCAYGSVDPDGHRYADAKMALSTLKQAITAIKAALEAKDEPVAWMYSPTGALFDICPNDADEGEFLPLYTTPPQRTWVKLTEEEIKPCWYEACQTDFELTSQLVVYFARAIEAKLKEKNS